MQKREVGRGGGAAPTPPKRGRPFGSTSSNSAVGGFASVGSGDSVAPATLLGPTLQVPTNFAEDEELVTNALETVLNIAPLLDLRIFSSSKPSFIKMTEKRAVQAILGMLGSSVRAWHCASAELIGRLIINPDNEPFLLPSTPQIYKRLVDLLSLPAVDAQAAAVGALYNLAEVNMDCRLRLANERWAIDRLLKVVRAPHPVPEVCRKAALILESLVSEPQNKAALLAHENAFVEILSSEGKYSDTFARILYELTRPNKVTTTRAVWGM